METNATQHGNSTLNRNSFRFHPLTGDRRFFDMKALHTQSLRHLPFKRHKPALWRRNRTAGQAVSTGNDIGFPIMQEPDAGNEYLSCPDLIDTGETNEPTMRPETMDGRGQNEDD